MQALFWQDNKKSCSERRKWMFLTSKHSSTEYLWTKERWLTAELKKVVEENENLLLEKWNFCPPKPVLSNAKSFKSVFYWYNVTHFLYNVLKRPQPSCTGLEEYVRWNRHGSEGYDNEHGKQRVASLTTCIKRWKNAER